MRKFKNRDHRVNENTKEVTVVAHNWSSAIAASAWVKRYFPGYKACLVSPENFASDSH